MWGGGNGKGRNGAAQKPNFRWHRPKGAAGGGGGLRQGGPLPPGVCFGNPDAHAAFPPRELGRERNFKKNPLVGKTKNISGTINGKKKKTLSKNKKNTWGVTLLHHPQSKNPQLQNGGPGPGFLRASARAQ